jgi:hypothetical protein
MPPGVALSKATQIAAAASTLRFFLSERYVVELIFAAEGALNFDLQPWLPLVLRADVV